MLIEFAARTTFKNKPGTLASVAICQYGTVRKNYAEQQPWKGALAFMKATSGQSPEVCYYFIDSAQQNPVGAAELSTKRFQFRKFAAGNQPRLDVSLANIPTIRQPVDLAQVSPVDGTHAVHRIYMAAAFTLATQIDKEKGYKIAAIIVGSNGQIISWGTNDSRNTNSLAHAERTAIERYLQFHGQSQLPDGCRIYTTLKPCLLCAGWIADTTQNSLLVYYGHQDNGTHARNTALDNNHSSIQMELGSGTEKPVRTYQDVEYKEPITFERQKNKVGPYLRQNLHAYLDRTVRGNIVQTLDTEAPREFKPVYQSLIRKLDKYFRYAKAAEFDSVHLNVIVVLLHVVEFLKLFAFQFDDQQMEEVQRMVTEIEKLNAAFLASISQ